MKTVLKVDGMTCGGCVNSIRTVIVKQDAKAKVEADLSTKSVSIESALKKDTLEQLVEKAGFFVLKE